MKRGLGAAWPVALGYFPVAVAFGALGAQAGLSPLWVQLTSLLVFAGASQFALVGLLAQGVPPLLAALLGLLLNLRHAFYGPALRPYLRGGPLEAFFLTDEVFAERLLTEERVAVIPGSSFGASGVGHVRICYATSEENLREALVRISRFVAKAREVAA